MTEKKNITHIGVIMDGNRRYTIQNSKKLFSGYLDGAKKAQKFVEWCIEENISEITLYAYSIENDLNRSLVEKKTLIKLFVGVFDDLLKNKQLEKDNIKIRFIGERQLIEEKIINLIEKIEAKTKNNKRIIVNIAFYYSGRQEIVNAVKNINQDTKNKKIKKQDINEDLIKKYTYLPDSQYPELILRTGFSHRLSNFLLWHCAYSELYFIDKLWPQIEKQDLINAIEFYKNSKNNYGK
ncbi:MAG: di-trans,poly-cis-decaprenylcistransferase [Candidatus Aenigmarchaeota archaeon ex4484_52]|nr:MAG: di-trans,poly-cis-decaprenylcistransferase [Candidatus Aenigmarchaeota archaeon ex4484_52]